MIELLLIPGILNPMGPGFDIGYVPPAPVVEEVVVAPEPLNTVLITDSILAGTENLVAEICPANVTLDGQGGRRMTEGWQFFDWVFSVTDQVPHYPDADQFVIVNGTNDLNFGHPDPTVFVPEVLDIIGDRPVRWVTVWNGEHEQGAAAFNDYLWNNQSIEEVINFNPNPDELVDFVHLDEAGQIRLITTICNNPTI